jgi:GTP pyrophosphokinase
MAAIGYGKFSARSVLGKLTPVTQPEATEESSGLASVVRRVFGTSSDSAALKVRGHDDLLTYRARCCNPIRGEEIIGYVTRGKGVAVHSRNCRNVRNLLFEPDRSIAVEWAKAGKTGTAQTYPVRLSIFSDDRFGMLKQITAVISDQHTNIQNIEAKTGNLQANIDVVIDIEDLRHMDRVISELRKIPGIRDVQRVQFRQ